MKDIIQPNLQELDSQSADEIESNEDWYGPW